jgi:rhodanese-related sulfurtransferase
VIFPDNAFTYTGSFRKHLPELFPSAPADAAAPTPPQSGMDEAGGEEATALVLGGAVLLDVRTPGEFQEQHIAEAVNLPLQAIQAGSVTGLPSDKAASILTICAAGKRSMAALEILRRQGYTNIKSIRGGMQAWTREGRPLRLK